MEVVVGLKGSALDKGQYAVYDEEGNITTLAYLKTLQPQPHVPTTCTNYGSGGYGNPKLDSCSGLK